MRDLYTYLIMEGGASGHMAHPYDYTQFTLRDLKGLIRNLFSGKVEDITEKIDGTNIQATMNNAGEVVFIRNKTDLNSTKGGMSIEDMANKWADKPHIKDTFIKAGETISKVFGEIGPKFFNPDDNTRLVANCECVIAGKTNIMPYSTDQVDFHNIWVYKKQNDEWVNTDVTKDGLDKIEKACEKVDGAQITPNVLIKVTDDAEKVLVEYIKRIDKIFKEAKVRENNTVEDWKHQRFNMYIKENDLKWIADNLDGYEALYERWFNGDKSVNIRDLKKIYADHEQELMQLDKSGYKDICAWCMKPLDDFFIDLGNDIIGLCDGIINADNKDQVVKELVKDLEDSVNMIQSSENKEANDKLFHQLERIEGMTPNAAEGIVFRYKGKLMKLTGAFAPLNQIIGMKYRI